MLTRSTTVVAVQLGVSQPSVSRALSQIESTLALRLFQRRKGQLLPTDHAEALCAPLAALLEESRLLQRRVAQLRAGEPPRTVLRVMLPALLAARRMPQVAAALARSHPHGILEVLVGEGKAAETALLAAEADLAVLRLPTQDGRLSTAPLLRSAPACLLPRDHPLARKQSLAAADLAGVGLILPPRSQRLRADIDALLKAARITPRLCAETDCLLTAAGMTALGLGVTLAAAYQLALLQDDALAQLPLLNTRGFEIGLAWSSAARLGLMQSGLVQSGLMQPGLMQPGLMQPGMTQSELAHTDMAQSGLAHPDPAQLGLAQALVHHLHTIMLDTASGPTPR